jgi:hypothetical protein
MKPVLQLRCLLNEILGYHGTSNGGATRALSEPVGLPHRAGRAAGLNA